MVWLRSRNTKKPGKHPKTKQNTDCSDYECCVVCGGRTATEKALPLSRRRYYVEGCGQLCEACYGEIYL